MKNLVRELETARKRSTGVLGVFQRFVEELEDSADHANAVAEQAKAKVQHYENLRNNAVSHAAEVSATARKIKGLLS